MAGEWLDASVEDIKAPSENALATGPFGSSIGSRFFSESGVPVIRGSNLSEDVGTHLDDEGLVYVSLEKAREFSRSTVRDGDLIFTCWGTVNQIGLIDRRAKYREYIISNKQMKLTPDPSKADSLFLYYLFSGPELQNRIRNQSIGSSVPGFNLGQLRSMRIRIPTLPEQRAIAHILGSLDDKIELNRRMNRTLEEMARAIFKIWFIDFDPVRAKAAVRRAHPKWTDEQVSRAACPKLKPEIARLFPDSFEDSELGEIPKGWEVKKLGDLLELAYGKALKAEKRCHGAFPVYGSNGPVGWHNESLVTGPGIVVGRKGNPGIVTWVPTDFFPIDTTFYVVPKSRCQSLEFLYHALRNHDLASLGADSAVPGLNRNLVYMSDQLLPPPQLLQEFSRITKAFWCRVQSVNDECLALAALRDALLPKLISGELRIPDAERIAARCA